MPLDFSTVPAETRQQMLSEGLITPDNELTGLGTLSANLAGTNLQNAQKQAIVAQFNQGFINPDFSLTETGRLQFMDKDTALFEGKDTFRKWYRQGGWKRHSNDKPNDPLHVAVGKAVDAIATETLPQAAQGVALGAASSLGLGKFVSWLTQQPLAKYAPGPLGQAAQAVQSAQKAGAPIPTGQELQDQLDKMAGVAGGNFLKELARNQALMDKGAKLVWAKWGTDMTQDDTEEIDALYEFEKAQYLINEIDAAEAVAAVTALAHVVDPDDPASQEQMLEATQRARAGVELARSELTPEAAEFAEKAGGSAGEIFDPTLIAPTFGGFGVRGIIAGTGRSTAKRITKIADDIAEKKALRETAQNALANANATEILGRVGVDRAALRKSVQELTTEIDELNNLAAKLTDRGYRGGVGRRALDTVGDATATSGKWVSGTWAGGVGRAIDNYFTAPKTLPGHAKNLAIAGTAAGAAVSAEQLAAASGVPGLQLGSNIAKGVAALALAPHLYRNAKTLARTTHALGAEFVARRSTLPYWRGVSKRMADNKLISGAAVTMDMFAKPLVPVGNVGKRAAQATLAEMPFSYLASGGQDGWFAEAIAEGLIFGAPGQVQGLIHSMGGMPAVMQKEYFDQLANNDAAELRRTLPKRHRQALDNFRPEIRRMIGSYSAMFPDLEFRFQPAPGDLSGSGYDKYTNTVYIDPNTRRPLDALLAHEVAHSIQQRGLDADIIDDLVGPNGLLRNEDGSLVEGARKFKAQYEKDLGRPISDETLAREWFAESAAPGLMRRQSLQKLVRRNPITRRLAESILPETSLGRQLLLRNGVLLDRNGRPVKGQGAMGAIVEGSPAMARIIDRYLRATAGDLPAADPTKAVEKAKERPLTPEEQENANRNNLIDFETNADGSQKKVNGRRIPVQPKTLKLQRITIGEEIEAFADELTFADAARMPEKLSLAEKINRFNEQDWEKLVDRLESAGIYNSSQIAMFREIFRRRAIGDSLSLKFNYQPAITTRNNRKKYDSRERELYTGAVYQIRVTKAKNVVLDIIDMDFLEQRAMKAAQTKLGQELYPAGTAAIMRDVMTLAENHVNKDPNSAVFTKPNQLNFLNGVLGRLSMEHKAKNPMASGRPAVRSLRLDRINQIAPTQQKGLPFIPERWRDNLMPEPADERFFGETEPVVSMENMPGMNTGVLQNLHAATPKQRQGFEESILETISDPEFGDVFGRAIDTRVKLAPLAPSVYVNTEGGIEINAAQQVGGFRSREDAELYALLRGLFMKQEAVAGNLPNPSGEMTAADFFVGTALDEAGVKKVMTGIIAELDEAGLGPAAAEDFAFYGNPEGFSLVHLGFNEAITPKIRSDVFAGQGVVLGIPNYKEYTSDTFYLDNNWKTTDVVTDYGEVKRASPSGEAYAAEIDARSRSTGRPDLLAGLADRVGARLQGVYDSFAAKEFGEPGRQLGGPGTEGFTLTGRPLSEVQRAPESDDIRRISDDDIRRMPEAADGSTPRMGVNINDATQAFTDQILAGEKTIETRDSNSLDPYLDQKVGLVRTGQGTATLVGYADIVGVKKYTSEAEFRKDQDAHLVEPGSKYDWTPKGKVGYVLANPEAVEPYALSSRGIVARDIRRMPEQLDADHRAAEQAGDLEAAQRMVDDAALKAGMVKAAHGMVGELEGNTFNRGRVGSRSGASRGGFSFTTDTDAAKAYAHFSNEEADVLWWAQKANEIFSAIPETSQAEVDGTSIKEVEWDTGAMDIDENALAQIPDDIRHYSDAIREHEPEAAAKLDSLAKRSPPQVQKGQVLEVYLSLNNPQTVQASIDAFGQDLWGVKATSESDVIVETDNGEKVYYVYSPSSIKSADPFTYDDQGNLIPLSERFNLESDDIRRMPDPVSKIEAERNELKSQKAELVANPILQISNTVPKQVVDEISGWKVVSKSPYSTSMYDITNKSWGEDPDNFLRVADHWNYETSADDRIHGRTDIELPPGTDWALGRYDADKGTYTILKAWEAAPPATSVSNYRRMQALRKLAAPDSRGFSLSPAQKRLLGRAMQEPVPLEGAVKRMHSNMEYAEALFDEKDGLITASEVGKAALPKGTAGNVSSLRAQKAARRVNVNAKPQQAEVLLDRADDDDIRRLPEPKATIEQFKGQNIQVLTSDMSIVQDIARGNKVVTMQGGPGYLDNRGWAFTSKEAAEAFRKRWQNQGQPLIGLTTLTPNNHLNSSDARRAYALRWQQAVKDGTFSKTAANKHVRQAMLRILASEATSSQMAAAKPVAKKIKTVDDLVKLFPTLPWGSSPIFYSKLTAKTVGIKHDKLQDAGLDLEGAANELRQPEFTGAGLGDLFAVARYDGSSPKYRPKLNKAYPWFIPLPDRALLKDMVPVGKLTTDKRVFVKKDVKRGKLSAQPLMTVGVILDKVKEGTLPKVMERKRIKLRPETKRTPSDTAKKIIGQAEAGRIEAFGKRNPMITPTKKAKKKPKKNKR